MRILKNKEILVCLYHSHVWGKEWNSIENMIDHIIKVVNSHYKYLIFNWIYIQYKPQRSLSRELWLELCFKKSHLLVVYKKAQRNWGDK